MKTRTWVIIFSVLTVVIIGFTLSINNGSLNTQKINGSLNTQKIAKIELKNGTQLLTGESREKREVVSYNDTLIRSFDNDSFWEFLDRGPDTIVIVRYRQSFYLVPGTLCEVVAQKSSDSILVRVINPPDNKRTTLSFLKNKIHKDDLAFLDSVPYKFELGNFDSFRKCICVPGDLFFINQNECQSMFKNLQMHNEAVKKEYVKIAPNKADEEKYQREEKEHLRKNILEQEKRKQADQELQKWIERQGVNKYFNTKSSLLLSPATSPETTTVFGMTSPIK